MKNIEDIVNRLGQIEAYANMIKEHVTVLKKELEDSGASKSSARKGKEKISAEHKANILAKREVQRRKKP